MQPFVSRRDAQDAARGVRIRNARRGEAEPLAALLAALGYPEAADAQTVNWVLSHPEMEVLVAVDTHDRPIGMLSLSHRPQRAIEGGLGLSAAAKVQAIAARDQPLQLVDQGDRGVQRALFGRAQLGCGREPLDQLVAAVGFHSADAPRGGVPVRGEKSYAPPRGGST